MNRIVLAAAVVATFLSGSAMAQSRAGASRVDFDDQLVQGQVNKGAVHLIERKDSDLGSLVKKRTSYRKEILAGTAVAEAKPVGSMAAIAVPVLPVVKAADLKGEAIETPAAAKPAPAAAAPAAKAAPAKKAVKKAPAKKKVGPAKKAQSKNTNGGSRVVSRR